MLSGENLNKETTLTQKDLMPVVRIDVPMPIGYRDKGLYPPAGTSGAFWKRKSKAGICGKTFSYFKCQSFWEKSKCIKNDSYR